MFDRIMKMPAPTTLKTERLLLRPLTLNDTEVMQRLAGKREIAAMTRSIPHPFSQEQATEWIAKTCDEMVHGRQFNFAAVLQSNGQMIGTTGIINIDTDHKSAEMGFLVGENWWGQGYATEAARAVVRFGFEALGLNRIHAHHMTKNPASGRVLDKVGMRREGLLRQAIFKWGQFEDVVTYAILRQDWTGEDVPNNNPL